MDATTSSVYFVEAVGLDLVKIGYSGNVRQRFTTMMTDSPAALTLLGVLPGGARTEGLIHARLQAHRSHGEWFHKTPDVLAVIATATPIDGQEWLNQKARVYGAALQAYLADMKAGKVKRPTRGPTSPAKRKTHDRYGNPIERRP